MLEEALHGADLDVAEPAAASPRERLLERVRQEDDRRAGLDPVPMLLLLRTVLGDSAPLHRAAASALAAVNTSSSDDVLVLGVRHPQVARAEDDRGDARLLRATSLPSRRRSWPGCCGLGGGTRSPVTASNAAPSPAAADAPTASACPGSAAATRTAAGARAATGRAGTRRDVRLDLADHVLVGTAAAGTRASSAAPPGRGSRPGTERPGRPGRCPA